MHTCTHAHFNDAGDVDSSQPVDSTWPPLTSPNRKKDKDVFRFLSQQKDPNYTVRKQQFQMNRILEKNKLVKQVKRERKGRGQNSLYYLPFSRGVNGVIIGL